jgi:hypothetical protein
MALHEYRGIRFDLGEVLVEVDSMATLQSVGTKRRNDDKPACMRTKASADDPTSDTDLTSTSNGSARTHR